MIDVVQAQDKERHKNKPPNVEERGPQERNDKSESKGDGGNQIEFLTHTRNVLDLRGGFNNYLRCKIYRLPDITTPFEFPNDFVTLPEGLLAVGGNLHPETLVNAYAKGIFPWFSDRDPILWWHPDPRLVLYPQDVKVSRSMRQFEDKFLRSAKGRVSFNEAFDQVIERCSQIPRHGQEDTWITESMIEAYKKLHELGYAHSVEVWKGEELVGGLYGIALSRVFFGESMFSSESNTSKLALIALARQLQKDDFVLIDCQQETEHLKSLGAVAISKRVFLEGLQKGETHLKEQWDASKNRQS